LAVVSEGAVNPVFVIKSLNKGFHFMTVDLRIFFNQCFHSGGICHKFFGVDVGFFFGYQFPLNVVGMVEHAAPEYLLFIIEEVFDVDAPVLRGFDQRERLVGRTVIVGRN
jgi:hypothetical protein